MFIVPHPGVPRVDGRDILVRPELEKAAPFLKRQVLSQGKRAKVGPAGGCQHTHLDVALATFAHALLSPGAKP